MNRANPIVDFAAKGYESRGKRIFAPKVGEAPSLVAGSSRSILSPTALEELFLFQRTANGAGGTGVAVFQSIKGNSIVWNQLVGDNDTEVTVPNGHKYFAIIGGTASVATSDGSPISVTGGVDMVTDLTLANMASIVTSVSDFTKFYNLPYYAPNPGIIKNNCATGMVTDGLNQWDEVTELGTYNSSGEKVASTTQIRCKNFIKVVPGTTYFINSDIFSAVRGYDADHNFVGNVGYTQVTGGHTLAVQSNMYYITFYMLASYGTTYKNDICINLSGSRNGQYEPHWSETTALPITTATGKLNGEGESVVISPDGLAGVGTSFDEAIVEKGLWTKTKKKMVKISIKADDDLSKFVLSSASLGVVFYTTGLGSEAKTLGNALTTNYGTDTTHQYSSQQTDMTVRLTEGGGISVKNTAQITGSITAEQARTLLAGMDIWIELATEQLYVLDTPVPVVARVDENGTQTITPQGVDGSGVPMTAPFAASIFYPEQMDKVYLTAADFKNFLDAAVSGGAITAYTMEWNAATGSYDFTVNQAAATLAAPASSE